MAWFTAAQRIPQNYEELTMSQNLDPNNNQAIAYDRDLDNLLSALIEHVSVNQIELMPFCEDCNLPHDLFSTLQEIQEFLDEQWGE